MRVGIAASNSLKASTDGFTAGFSVILALGLLFVAPATLSAAELTDDILFEIVKFPINRLHRAMTEDDKFDIASPDNFLSRMQVAEGPLKEARNAGPDSSDIEMDGHVLTIPFAGIKPMGKSKIYYRWVKGNQQFFFAEGSGKGMRKYLRLAQNMKADIGKLLLKRTNAELVSHAELPLPDLYSVWLDTTAADVAATRPLHKRLCSLVILSAKPMLFTFGDWEHLLRLRGKTLTVIVTAPKKSVSVSKNLETGEEKRTVSFDFSGILIDKKTDTDWSFSYTDPTREGAEAFYRKIPGIFGAATVKKAKPGTDK